MIGKRHQAIGIKQTIRFEWMQKVANLQLAGLNAKMIRQELHEFLAESEGSGSGRKRSDQTRSFVITNLMKIWVSPEPDLIEFRDASLAFLRENPSLALAVHWAMSSAVYPFWFNVARQTGRLLSMQDQVAQSQIIVRLKEQYGDRQTVSRTTQFVIRSFVAWGVLKDSKTKGCYEKSTLKNIGNPNLSIMMIESALLVTPEGSGALVPLLNNPAFFPFRVPVITGDFVSKNSQRIDVARFGLEDEMLKLKVKQLKIETRSD